MAQSFLNRICFSVFAAALFAAVPSSYEAQAGTVPSTLADTLDGPTSSVRINQDVRLAQPFVTGDATHLVDAFTVSLVGAGSVSVAAVEIRLDSFGQPGSVLANLGEQSILEDHLREYRFAPSFGVVSLQPNTRYWVVLRAVSNAIDWGSRVASGPGVLDEEASSGNGGASWMDTNVANRYLAMKVAGCLVPRMSVSDAVVTEPDGTTQMNFTLTLSGPPGQDFALLATTTQGTATAGADYVSLTAQSFQFTAGGSTTRTVSVTINGDSLVEDDESFTLTLTAANSDTLIVDDGVATGTIVDNDSALFDDFDDGDDTGWRRYDPLNLVSFTFPDGGYRIQAGGNPGRGAALREDLVELDFVVGTEVTTWDAGLDQGIGLIARSGGFEDLRPEGYAFLYFPALAQAQIVRLDNEFATTIGSVSVSPPLDSNDAHWFTFTGQGSSMEGKIYRMDSLATPVATVNASDSRHVGGISGVYARSRLLNGVSGADATFDNFLSSSSIPPLLAIGPVTSDAAENQSGSHSFEVTRGGVTDVAVTVGWSVSGSGAHPAAASDFGSVLPSGTVTFASGEVSKTISFNIVADTQVEADESYLLTLNGATARAVIMGDSLEGWIRNDDSAQLNVGFGENRLEAYEGRDGIHRVVTAVQLTGPVDTDVVAIITTNDDGATAADNDYVPLVDHEVTIPAGQVIQPFPITINGDTKAESSFELFQVRIVGFEADGRDVVIGDSPRPITILNDDVEVTVTGGPAELVEGSGAGGAQFAYTISIPTPLQSNLDLGWAVMGSGDHPVSAADFTAADGTATITAGSVSTGLTLSVVGDHDLEPLETFELSIGPAPAAQPAVEGPAASTAGIGKQGTTMAALGASGGLDGSGRILTPDGTGSADGNLVALVAFGAAQDRATLYRHLQDGTALANYQTFLNEGRLTQLAAFAVNSSLGHAGAFSDSEMVGLAAEGERVFLIAFNAATAGAATAAGIFGNLDGWFRPTSAGQPVSLDARMASESYWGQLVPASPDGFDLRMTPLPGSPDLLKVGTITVAGAISNDDEIAGIGSVMNNMIELQHIGRPNTIYELEISDNLVDWFLLTTVSTDANGAASFSEPRIDKLGRRFYRFKLSDN